MGLILHQLPFILTTQLIKTLWRIKENSVVLMSRSSHTTKLMHNIKLISHITSPWMGFKASSQFTSSQNMEMLNQLLLSQIALSTAQ